MCARGKAREASSTSINARKAANSSIRSFDSSGVATRPEGDMDSAPSATKRRTASRALPRAHMALIERLQRINALIAAAIDEHDAVTYIRRNLEFHRTLYLRAQAPAMLAMAETVWLQLGPTMRKLYGRMQRKEPPVNHKLILAALKSGDEPGLRLAVRSDVTQGLKMLAT
jgi:DNA-binding GntR family transcriptional regulator